MFDQIPAFIPPRLGRTRNIHFIGIGGVGMCGIAEVLHNLGYQISGSDQSENANTLRLRNAGVTIFIGHQEDNIAKADVVVISTMIPENNVELLCAKRQRLPIIPRAEMLAELMRLQHGIAIAGTHGKTTTTSLVASVLAAGGLDPTYVIGGKLNQSGSNAYLGKSAYFVAEADESDASFLFLQPVVSIVTNIDADHMETYQGDFGKLCQTFLDFIHRLPFYGMAVLCQDDPILAGLFSSVSRPYVTYGFSPQAQYRASDYTTQGTQSHFVITRPAPFSKLEITLNMPGQHNALNSLSAIVVATEHGVSDAAIQSGLAKFNGVNRRLTQRGQFHLPAGEILLLDDYGHHPREISVTIAAIRAAWPGRRILHVFQPHRFSRTASLWGDFVSVLSQSDYLLLMDIYPANETPLPGITSERMLSDIQALGGHARFAPKSSSFMSDLQMNLQNGDIVLLQGAGDIGSLCNQVADYLGSQSRALA